MCVDDGSCDGSWEELQKLAAAEPRIRAFRHERNRGKGAAIRTAIEHMTGDVAVIQDADLEYDPNDYLSLLVPILDGRADAVFGSRFVGGDPWVAAGPLLLAPGGQRLLTLLSNMANDVNLTDMETCYKMVRADVLRQLRLPSNTFTLEPEITCRLAQWGARIYEVPISYSGRTYLEGKKIKAIDGVKVLWRTAPLPLARSAVHPSPRVLHAEIDRPGPQLQPLAAGGVPPLAGLADPGSRGGDRQPQFAVVGPLAAGAGGQRAHVYHPLAGTVRPARQRAA